MQNWFCALWQNKSGHWFENWMLRPSRTLFKMKQICWEKSFVFADSYECIWISRVQFVSSHLEMLLDSYFEVLFKLKIFFQSYFTFNSVKLFLYYFCIISSFVFVAILIVCVPFFCIVFKWLRYIWGFFHIEIIYSKKLKEHFKHIRSSSGSTSCDTKPS